MNLKSSKKARIVAAFAAGAFGLSGCNDAGFRGGEKKASADGLEANTRKSTPTLSKGGWMDSKAQDAWRKIFDEASAGSNPLSSGNSSSTPVGPTSAELLKGVDGVLWIPCGTDAEKVNEFSADFASKKGSRVRLSGEFCPAASAEEITILFVIDHSGSMEGGDLSGGPNDPTSANGCRRLDASRILMDKYAALKSTNVRAGVVSFAARAQIEVPISGIAEIQKKMNASTFCGLKPALGSLTNYEEAFSYARKALEDIDGPKIVYFITDGRPTTMGNGSRLEIPPAETAGLQSAEKLRDTKGVSINALFVGFKGVGGDPRGYLEEITGDKDSVRVTKDAEELVKAAASLNIGPVKITKEDTEVKIKNPSGDLGVGMARVTATPGKYGAHIWVTDPFVLVGTTDQVVKNVLTATARTSAGDSLKTVATINFKQLD